LLNVHFHTLVPDGVFVIEGGEAARFVPIAPPNDEEVEKVLITVIRKVARLGLPGDDGEWTGADEDAFAALQAAELPKLRVAGSSPVSSSKPGAGNPLRKANGFPARSLSSPARAARMQQAARSSRRRPLRPAPLRGGHPEPKPLDLGAKEPRGQGRVPLHRDPHVGVSEHCRHRSRRRPRMPPEDDMEALSLALLARMISTDFARACGCAPMEEMVRDLANRIETGLRTATRRQRDAFVAQCDARAELWTRTEQRAGAPEILRSEARARANEAAYLADACAVGADRPPGARPGRRPRIQAERVRPERRGGWRRRGRPSACSGIESVGE